MTKKHFIIVFIFLFLVVLIAGGIRYFFVDRSDIPSPNDIQTSSSATTFPPAVPEGYDILINKNPAMREDLKKNLTDKFNGTIEGLKTDSWNSLLWYDLGSIKYSFEDYKGAESAWKYAIKIDPLATFALMNLATLYQYKIPDYPEAERILRIVIENEPKIAMQAYSEIFDLYRYRYKEKANLAEGVMLEAYREFPDQHAILKTIAWYYLEQKNDTKAIEYFEKFLAKAPGDASAQEELDRLKNSSL